MLAFSKLNPDLSSRLTAIFVAPVSFLVYVGGAIRNMLLLDPEILDPVSLREGSVGEQEKAGPVSDTGGRERMSFSCTEILQRPRLRQVYSSGEGRLEGHERLWRAAMNATGRSPEHL